MNMKDKYRYDLVGLSLYNIYENCLIVTNDVNMSAIGYKCKNCGGPSRGSISYFDMNVLGLLELMEEFALLESSQKQKYLSFSGNRVNKHWIAIIILFCTLGEVLLNNLLTHLMDLQKIPPNVQKRLFDDNILTKQRIEKIFPALTGVKWKKSIGKINAVSRNDYVSLFKFYQSVVKVRNEFIHKGNEWIVPNGMPENCFKYTKLLISMFIDLHNKYVA
jgi:hypothetical protein